MLINFKFKNFILYLAKVIPLKVNDLAPTIDALTPDNTLRFIWLLRRNL